ncbi:hypothetical protein EGH82_23580, partial [Vibrio ponticus]
TEYLFEMSYADAVNKKVLLFISDPIKFIFEGGRAHLWFLSSLIFINILFSKRSISEVLLVGSLLYLIGCIFGSYSKPIFGEDYIDIVNTRNGLYLSCICWALGLGIKNLASINNRCYSRIISYSLMITILGMVGHLLEIYILKKYSDVSLIRHDYVFSTVIYALGFFLLSLKIRNKINGNAMETLTVKLAPYTLGVYLMHPFIIDIINATIVPKIPINMLAIWQVAYIFIVFVLSIILIKVACYGQFFKKVLQ